MRKPIGKLIGRFALIFSVVLICLASVWPQVAPAYTSSVVAAARPLFRVIESPDRTVLDVQRDTLSVYRIVGEGRISPVIDFDRYTFVLAIPLVALLLATPGLGIRRRITRTLAGIALLWVVQVAYLLSAVGIVQAMVSGRDAGGWEIAVRVLWEAAPLLIWIGLTASAWRHVFKKLRSEGSEKTDTEETIGCEAPSPEPMGADG